jgi:DNA sulfur modification protein DndC
MILKKLLITQKQMNYELITEDELRAIDQIWDEEKIFHAAH